MEWTKTKIKQWKIRAVKSLKKRKLSDRDRKAYAQSIKRLAERKEKEIEERQQGS